MITEEQRRAYTETERTHNDHIYLDKRHHNAPKDANDDPVFTEGGE